MPDEPRLDEQIVSQAVQTGLSHQLEEADAVTVDVRTDPLKAAQGKADSVAVNGQGVVVQGVRVQALEVQTDGINLDPLSVLFGKLKLNQAIDATARVVLTEADLNQAVNAAAIVSRMPTLEIQVDRNVVTLELQHPLAVRLPEDHKIELDGKVLIHTPTGTQPLEFAAVLVPPVEGHPVRMEAFRCQPGSGLSIDFILALMQRFKALLALPYLEIEGMAIHIKYLNVQAGRLTLETEAHVSSLPST